MKRMPCTFAGALREGRSPWQLGRASRSCFENICVFDLKMIQSKDDTVYVKYKMPQNSRGPFSRGKALCVLPPVPCQSKEKALHRLSFRRQSWFWWLFALCPLCLCPHHCSEMCTAQTQQGPGQELMQIAADRERPEWPASQNFLNPHNI